jgi:hypothetical protein
MLDLPFLPTEMDLKIIDNYLSCGSRFVGVEKKLAVRFEGDTHARIAYLCPDCALTKMAVLS